MNAPANIIDRRALLIHARTKRDGRKKAKVIREGSVVLRVFPVREYGRKIRYEVRGGSKRPKFSTQTEAEQFAREQAVRILNGKIASSDLSRDELIEFCKANHVTVNDVRLTLWFKERGLLAEQRTGRKLAPVQFFDQLCTEYEQRHTQQLGRLIPDVVKEFLAHIRAIADAQKGSLHHWQMLTSRLTRFATVFNGPLAALNPAAVEAWLKTLKLAPKTWNHYRDPICQVVRWSVGKEYCDEKLLKAVLRIHRFKKVKSRAPNPYSPAELRTLLDYTQQHDPWFVPYIVLVAFCGYRSEEVVHRQKGIADWSEVNFERQELFIPASRSKVGLDRFPHFPDNAVAWLRLHAKPGGRICPIVKPDQKLRKIRATLGLAAHENGLRSAFLNHRLAVTSDIVKVADEGGTSPAKIRTNYQKRPSERIGRSYFKIFPDEKQLWLL